MPQSSVINSNFQTVFFTFIHITRPVVKTKPIELPCIEKRVKQESKYLVVVALNKLITKYAYTYHNYFERSFLVNNAILIQMHGYMDHFRA